jgi:hypothetical protein
LKTATGTDGETHNGLVVLSIELEQVWAAHFSCAPIAPESAIRVSVFCLGGVYTPSGVSVRGFCCQGEEAGGLVRCLAPKCHAAPSRRHASGSFRRQAQLLRHMAPG